MATRIVFDKTTNQLELRADSDFTAWLVPSSIYEKWYTLHVISHHADIVPRKLGTLEEQKAVVERALYSKSQESPVS